MIESGFEALVLKECVFLAYAREHPHMLNLFGRQWFGIICLFLRNRSGGHSFVFVPFPYGIGRASNFCSTFLFFQVGLCCSQIQDGGNSKQHCRTFEASVESECLVDFKWQCLEKNSNLCIECYLRCQGIFFSFLITERYFWNA